MKRTKQILAMLLCAVLLVTGTVAVTVAYLTSTTEEVKNTFTVGNIVIDLDEAYVNKDGELLDTAGNVYEGKEGQELATRVRENTYRLLPGHEYVKDPTVTVEEKSEDAYIRIKVAVSDMEKLEKAFTKEKYSTWYVNDVFYLQNLVEGWDNDIWECKAYDAATSTYEFWYVGEKADGNGVVPYSDSVTVLEPLFEKVVVPGELSNTEIGFLDEVEISIIAYAIQADGFENATEAWGEWPN